MTKEATIINFYREQIHRRVLKENEVLPTENEMCDIFGASRMTVRKALDKMSALGWLYRISGSGTYVAPTAFERIFTVQGFSRYMSERGYCVSSRVLEFGVCAAPAGAAVSLRLSAGERVYRLVRARAADDRLLAIESVCLQAARFPGLERHDFSRESLYVVMRDEYDCEITSSTQRLGTARIDGEYARLLFGSYSDVAMRAVNLGYTANGVCVEYDESLYNGYEFTININVKKEWGA